MKGLGMSDGFWARVERWPGFVYARAARDAGAGDYEGAISQLTEVLSVDPTDGFALRMVARCHAGKGDGEGALSVALRAVDAHPDDYYSLALLGYLYVKRGDHEHAKAIVERSLEHVPRHSPALYRFLRLWMYLIRAINLVCGVPATAEDVEAFKDPGKDEREWDQWAREYLRWHANLPAQHLPHGGEGTPAL